MAEKTESSQRQRTHTALEKLLELSRVLVTTRDLDIALTQAATWAVDIVQPADKCTLQWLEADGETLGTVAFSDPGDVRKDVAPFRPGVGIAGHALASRELINVPDVLEDERFVPGDPPLRFRSLLVAPLVVKDHDLGTLSLSSQEVQAFSTTDETLAGLVADQIAAALDNAHEFTARRHAESALQHLTERLRIVHEIDQSILAAQLPETIAVAVIRRIRRLSPCQRAIVTTFDDEGQIHLLAAESSAEIELVEDISVYQEMHQQRTLRSGWAHGVADLSALPQRTPLQNALLAEGVQSYVIVPVFIQDELVGTLNLESIYPRVFTSEHVETATEVTASLAVAIRQAQLYERAQQEIAERLRVEETLRRYAADLEARNQELDAFAHTVAHDLKNPVTSVIAYAQVLERELDMLQPEMRQKFTHVIVQNGRKLATIIDELLLLSSVRQMDEIEVSPLDMAKIVAEARGRVLYLIEEYQGEIALPESWPVAFGYAPWVEAMWTNYISNGLKYGGTPPHVELGAAVQDNGWVRFWVRDNGPGLSPEQQARLFTPFERLSRMRAEGHGLGLTIVQRIAKRLNGQVGVESEGVEGMGCTFYFTLPGLSTTEE